MRLSHERTLAIAMNEITSRLGMRQSRPSVEGVRLNHSEETGFQRHHRHRRENLGPIKPLGGDASASRSDSVVALIVTEE
jgi:hypothetical protein